MNTNGLWKIVTTHNLGRTPGDTSLAATIATATAAITTAKQRTAGTALTASSITDFKVIKFPTIIGKNNDDGTAVIEINQDQLNEII